MYDHPLVKYPSKFGLWFVANLFPKPTFLDRIFSCRRVLPFLILSCLLYSCKPVKSTAYFQNLKKDTTIRNLISKDLEPKIQKGDILGISVASLSPDAPLYNSIPSSGVTASSASAATSSPNGYLVDQRGNIDFIKLGVLQAAGLTKKELKSALENGLIPYLKNVTVTVTFLNRHITMLGGITSQVLPMLSDNMTILDALAATGDITEKGRTDNVLVIREKGDSVKEFKRLNLTNNSVFSSPYFFMQPNDIVYVEPQKIKPPISTVQLISIITSGVSLLILILNTVKL